MSGGPQILVTFAELANAEQSISSTAQSLTSKLDELRQYLNPIVKDWTGAAAESYQQQQQKWNQAQDDLTNVLSGIGKAVAAAHDAYQQTEKSNQSMWQ